MADRLALHELLAGEQSREGGGASARGPGTPGRLTHGPRLALHALPLLFHRQLDNNHISCIEVGAFRALRDLEIL